MRLSLVVCVLTLVTGCSGNTNLENLFNPDAKLKGNPTPVASPTPSPNATPSKTENRFPTEIPQYPEAKLLTTEAGATANETITRWTSADPSNAIALYYQQQFQANNWEIITPFTSDTSDPNNRLVARKNDLEVSLSLASSSAQTTEFIIAYQTNTPQSQTPNSDPSAIAPNPPNQFTDLDQVAEPLRQYIKDLAALGVLTGNQDSENQFNPNDTITRREFARWLVAANNSLYRNQPGKQIRLGSKTSQAAFSDVPPNDPDFPVIQGLAEAGLIPSSLTGDNTASLFRANTPLTREDLILWKLPLDNRKALPSASIDGIKESWGFQDANKIDPKALKAIYADYQNGEQANIRRMFGYTTLFQPKKALTRAEAAAALWYFGYQGDGISAADALK